MIDQFYEGGQLDLAVPDFQSLILPLLQHVADGEQYTLAGSRDVLADLLNLSEDDRKQRLPSGAANLFYNRLAWAKTYLERAGLIEKVSRGVFRISENGLKVLAAPPARIDIAFLQQFPQFAEFRKKGVSNNSAPEATTKAVESDATPEEDLEAAYGRLHDELAVELLSQIRQCHPSFFERLVVDVLLKMGYGGPGDDAGSVTSYGNDSGVDGMINEDALGLDVIYLQAKRWESTIGRPEIQRFVGALHGKRAKKGVFLTTSSFSSDALEYVRTIDPKVVLIDGARLANLMIEYNVGVSTSRVFELKKIDSDYFDSD